METTEQINLLSVWKTFIGISLKKSFHYSFLGEGGWGGVAFGDETKRASRETRVNVIKMKLTEEKRYCNFWLRLFPSVVRLNVVGMCIT